MARASLAHRLSRMYCCNASYVASRTRVFTSLRKSVFGRAMVTLQKNPAGHTASGASHPAEETTTPGGGVEDEAASKPRSSSSSDIHSPAATSLATAAGNASAGFGYRSGRTMCGVTRQPVAAQIWRTRSADAPRALYFWIIW